MSEANAVVSGHNTGFTILAVVSGQLVLLASIVSGHLVLLASIVSGHLAPSVFPRPISASLFRPSLLLPL